jgi:HTH-type transcriptional regulator/antitoxin HigA
MLTQQVAAIERTWPILSPVITVPHSEADYDKLVSLLDALIDLVGEDEEHPLASLMELIGVLIERYEDEHVPELTSF